ncbi:hypothetical protein MTR_1g091930 [Medicago truncatula]|uniref:Uncharacterized protein n=1 Tax=Medicago truncatula TaxID=3880 RepID=A0A072VP45_MEDTR|nr:hypothetical protein MTR_1g091930 [Medicago truncatula]
MGNFDISTFKQRQHVSLFSLVRSPTTVHHHGPPPPPSSSLTTTAIVLTIPAVPSFHSSRPRLHITDDPFFSLTPPESVRITTVLTNIKSSLRKQICSKLR